MEYDSASTPTELLAASDHAGRLLRNLKERRRLWSRISPEGRGWYVFAAFARAGLGIVAAAILMTGLNRLGAVLDTARATDGRSPGDALSQVALGLVTLLVLIAFGEFAARRRMDALIDLLKRDGVLDEQP